MSQTLLDGISVKKRFLALSVAKYLVKVEYDFFLYQIEFLSLTTKVMKIITVNNRYSFPLDLKQITCLTQFWEAMHIVCM